jgi:cytochrome c oxidase subunit 1
MTWGRLSLFSWALYATSIIQVLATPVLAITLFSSILERFVRPRHLRPEARRRPDPLPALLLVLLAPAVYIMIVPGMGIVSELIGTFARKQVVGYWFIAMSSLGSRSSASSSGATTSS